MAQEPKITTGANDRPRNETIGQTGGGAPDDSSRPVEVDDAQIKADGRVTEDVARAALLMLDVDEFGLDDMDARILKAIIEKFEGGPVGVNTIAAAVGEDAATIEEVYEPFLVQNGFLSRTPRGRMATPLAYRHFGYTPPSQVPQQQALF